MSEENGRVKPVLKTVQLPVDLWEFIQEMADRTGLSMRVVTEVLLRKVIEPPRKPEETPEAKVDRFLQELRVS